MGKNEDEEFLREMAKGPLTCPECPGICQPTTIDMEGLPIKGWECDKCGFKIVAPEDVGRAYNYLQAKKHARVKISKRGNSYMITIPKAIVDALELDKVKELEVYLEDEHTIAVKV
jgi:hypothetical protein